MLTPLILALTRERSPRLRAGLLGEQHESLVTQCALKDLPRMRGDDELARWG